MRLCEVLLKKQDETVGIVNFYKLYFDRDCDSVNGYRLGCALTT